MVLLVGGLELKVRAVGFRTVFVRPWGARVV